MKLATYRTGGERMVGRVSDDGLILYRLGLAPADAADGVLALVRSAASGVALPPETGDTVAVGDVTLEAPIPLPRRDLICVGRNYHAHGRELAGSVFKNSGSEAESWPIIFTKAPTTVVGPHVAVPLHPHITTEVDYEAELALIVGKEGRDITADNALDHVYGYTVLNDVTARDVQMRHQQWHLGKSLDGFCPMGPWIVTVDAFDGARTRVRSWVNDEPRQLGLTEDLIFDIPTLIATCSRGTTLYPGDIIATGTPAGVGMGLTPPVYLKDGDVVRVEIDGLGIIENRFVL